LAGPDSGLEEQASSSFQSLINANEIACRRNFSKRETSVWNVGG
jgi:hypothetical protein